MGEYAAALGTGIEIEHKGKRYKVAPFDRQDIKAMYERWMEEEAWRSLAVARRVLPPDEYLEQAAGVRQDVVSGVYSWGGMAWLSSIKAFRGRQQLTYLAIKAHHPEPEVTRALTDEIHDANLERITAHLMEQSPDPNPAAPDSPGTI